MNGNGSLEFSTHAGATKEELLQTISNYVRTAQDTIHNATALQYETVREVQGFNFLVLESLLHAVEHFSYHTGQIAFWVKQMTQEELGFYDGNRFNSKQ